jgi:hypothetical protein
LSVISRTVTSSTTGASIRTGAEWADQFIGILQVNSEPPIEHERCRNPRRSNGRGITSHPFVWPIKDNFLATGANQGPLMAQPFRTAYGSFALDSGPSRANPVDPDFVQLRPPRPRVGKQSRTRDGARHRHWPMVHIRSNALSEGFAAETSASHPIVSRRGVGQVWAGYLL